MGGLSRCCIWSSVFILVSCVVFILSLFLLPCMPPYVHFPEYTGADPEPLTSKSEVLNGVERMHSGVLRGPEALAMRRSDKDGAQLFTGLLGGRVVRLDLDKPGSNVTTVTRLGNSNCTSEVEGEVCGRPTGMQFHQDGDLYVLDAYHGLYKVNVDNGTWHHLAGGEQKIGGARVRLAYDLAVARDGRVFWTDASTQTGPEDVLLELLATPSGRLLRYDPKTNRSEMLIGLLHCATGVALSRDESFVLVAEAGKDRILRYYLDGLRSNTWDVFAEGLPGVPAKIQRGGPGGEDGYLVTLALTHPSILQFLRRHPSLGKALMRLMAATEAVFSAVNDVFQNTVSRDVQYMLGNPQLIAPLLHGGAVIALNSSGHVIRALLSSDGSAGVISQLETMDDFVYLASPYNPFLGRLNLTEELRQNLQDLELTINTSLPEKTSSMEHTTENSAQERQSIDTNQIPIPEDHTESHVESHATTTIDRIETEIINRNNQSIDNSLLLEAMKSNQTTDETRITQETTTYEPEEFTTAFSEDFEDYESTTGTDEGYSDFIEDTTLSNQVEQFTASNNNDNREPEKLLNLRDIIKTQV